MRCLAVVNLNDRRPYLKPTWYAFVALTKSRDLEDAVQARADPAYWFAWPNSELPAASFTLASASLLPPPATGDCHQNGQ